MSSFSMQLVQCLICNKLFKRISSTHLKGHHITTSEYLERFPEATITSPSLQAEVATRMREQNKKNIGRKLSKETKQKISNTKKNNKREAWNKGIPKTDEQKKQISDTKKRLYQTGKIVHWNLGGKVSDETKIKIRQSLAQTREDQGYALSEKSLAKRQCTIESKKHEGWIHPSTKRKGEKSTLSKEERRKKYFFSNEKMMARNQVSKERKRKRLVEYLKPFNLSLLDISDDQYTYQLRCDKCSTEFSRTFSLFVPSKAHLYEGQFCPTCFPSIQGYYSYQLFEDKPYLKNEKGIFYIVELQDGNGEHFIKIGITNRNVSERYRGENVTIVRTIVEYRTTLFHAFDIEYRILHTMSTRYVPSIIFGGITECFSVVDVNEIVNKFNEYSTRVQQ